MTDKERYEAAMEENHRLREELKDWKESFNAIVAENKKLRDQVLNLGNKVAENEFEILDQNLTNRMINMEVALQLREETEVTTNTANAG